MGDLWRCGSVKRSCMMDELCCTVQYNKAGIDGSGQLGTLVLVRRRTGACLSVTAAAEVLR